MRSNVHILCICFLACTVSIARTGPAGADEQNQLDPRRWEERIKAFEKQAAVSPAGVLFTGSSSIRMWDLVRDFPRWQPVNHGFGGSHLADVEHFADRIIYPRKPRVVVIYAGDNDVASGKNVETVLRDFQRLADNIHTHLPDAKIVYLAIKPSRARWPLYPMMREANTKIRDNLRNDPRGIFVDIATPMLDKEGMPREDIFLEDGLHLNAAGYALWTAALEPVLEALLE